MSKNKKQKINMALSAQDTKRINRTIRREESLEIKDLLSTKVVKSKKAYNRKSKYKNDWLLEE